MEASGSGLLAIACFPLSRYSGIFRYSAFKHLPDRQNLFHSRSVKWYWSALNHKSVKAPLAHLVIDLAEAQEKLRKIQREIGRMNSKTQIGYLMKTREDIMKTVESKKSLLSNKIDLEPLDLEIFRAIYRALSVYVRSVIESVIMSFERESGDQPLGISENAETFLKCLQKVFGRSSSRKIESTIVF